MTVVSAAPPSPLRDNATVTPVCATEVVSPEFMDESFPAFDAYGSTEEQEFASQEEKKSDKIWYLLSTILFLRLHRFIFGIAGFARSILFGHCLKFILTYLSPSPETWEAISHSPWLEPLLGNQNAKDPHAWPPPTLRVLAILTILAFIVHPDGMTWVLLGKLRNAIYTLLESSTTCWNFIIADYGILTTMAALATFCCLFCLLFVMFKTLSSKTPKTTQSSRKAPDRKKKKRKGNNPRGGRGRIKGKSKQQQHSAVETQLTASPPQKPEAEEVSCSVEQEEEVVPIDTSLHKTEFLPKELTTKGPALQPSRSRGESSSTVETTLMDDHSIDAVSVQSISSAPSAASTVVSRSPRSLNRLEEGKKKNSDNNKKRANTNKKSGRKGSAANKGYGAASPLRPDVYRPPNKNANSSPVNTTPVNTPNSGRSRPRRPNNASGGRPFRSLADRMASSPVPPSNGSLFSTPLSSPAHHASVTPTTTDKRNPSREPCLQAPILTPSPSKPSSSLFSHETTASTPTVRNGAPTAFYNASSYDSFSPGGGRSTPGKIELAAFLARAGLVGTACEDLVEALANVDALYRLSDAQFELYNVSPLMKQRIDMMLEARRRARVESASPSATASPVVTRPPPGLSAPPGIAQSESHHSAVLMSPPRLNQATYASGSSPSPGYSSTTTTRTDVDFGGSPTLSGIKPQLPSLSHPVSLNHVHGNSVYDQGDEEIEAELQELGGQMVGSILDF